MKKISPIACVLSGFLVLGSIGSTILAWISLNVRTYSGEGYSYWEIIRLILKFRDVDPELKLAFICYTVLFGIAALIAFICAFAGVKGAVGFYFFVTLALPLVPILLFQRLLDELGVGSYASYAGISPLSIVGLGGWLCPALALVAFLLLFVEEPVEAPVPSVTFVTSSTTYMPDVHAPREKYCPNCGKKLDPDFKFCDGCGRSV